jgi:hypothetical protein
LRKDRIKKIGTICFAFAVVIYFGMLVFSPILSPVLTPILNLHLAVSRFERNSEIITLVRDFLAESEYDDIIITPHRGHKILFASGNDPPYAHISNEEVEKAIRQLQQKNYRVIAKKNSVIYFGRQAVGISSVLRGVVYSVERHIPDESAIPYLQRIEPLTEEGWYYFERF